MTQTIFVNRWGQSHQYNPQTMTYLTRSCTFAVLHAGGKVLVMFPPVKHGGCDLPGGGIDSGENLAQALVREVEEETGFNIEDTTPLKSFAHQFKFCFDNADRVADMHEHFFLLDVAHRADMIFDGRRPHVDPASGQTVFIEWLNIEDVIPAGLRFDHHAALREFFPERADSLGRVAVVGV